jgi:hypothetical protein
MIFVLNANDETSSKKEQYNSTIAYIENIKVGIGVKKPYS